MTLPYKKKRNKISFLILFRLILISFHICFKVNIIWSSMKGVKLWRKNVVYSCHYGNQYLARKWNYIFLQSRKSVQHALKPLTCKRFISWPCLIFLVNMIAWNSISNNRNLIIWDLFKKVSQACHLIFWILCKLNQTCNPIDAQKCTRSKLFCILQIIQKQD